MFVGTEIGPPSRGRTPTPPPAPLHPVGAAESPDPARGGNVPARGKGLPTPPPAPMAAGGIGTGGRQMSTLEAAFARAMLARTPDSSSQRARSEHEQVGGPVATKARTLAPPNVLRTYSHQLVKLQLVVIFLVILMRHWRALRVCQGIILSIADLASIVFHWFFQVRFL